MAIPVHLQQFKAAGIYRVVFDKSTVLNVNSEILRLVVGYSEKGPFNIPVYITNVTDFRNAFGDISKKLEKRGVYFHRLALQALSSGPILCLNLKKFENEHVDGATISTAFNSKYEAIETVDIKIEDIYNTHRFWELDAEKLNDLKTMDGSRMDQYINICTTNTKETSATYFIRKAAGNKVSQYNITVSDWYSQDEDSMPEFLENYQNSLISDFFAEIYVFGTKFTAPQVLASSTLKKYFTIATDGDNNVQLDDEGNPVLQLNDHITNAYGDWVDTLDSLYVDETSHAIGHYIGCLIPEFKDKKNSYISLDAIFNADQESHNMMMSFNTDLLYEDGNIEVDLSGRLSVATDPNSTLTLDKLFNGNATTNLLGNKNAKVITNRIQFSNNVVTQNEKSGLWEPIIALSQSARKIMGTLYVKEFDPQNTETITLQQVGSDDTITVTCSSVADFWQIGVKLGCAYESNSKDDEATRVEVQINGSPVTKYFKKYDNCYGTYCESSENDSPFIDNVVEDGTIVSNEFSKYGPQRIITSIARIERQGNNDRLYDDSDMNMKVSILDVVTTMTNDEEESVYGSSITFIPLSEGWDLNEHDETENGACTISSDTIYENNIYSTLQIGDCLLAADGSTTEDGAKDNFYDNVYVQDIYTVNNDETGLIEKYVIKFSGLPHIYIHGSASFLIRVDAPINQEIGTMIPQYLEGYVYENPKPESTDMYSKLKWQKFILSALTDYKGLRTGLLNKSDIDYRYIIDTFESYVDSSCKSILSYLAKQKQSAFAILNFPSVKTFVKCPYTSFTNSDGVFNVDYVAKGYNKKKPTSIRFSLPEDNEGASFCAFYTPLKFSDGYVDNIVPAAGLVSNLFMQKYTSRQPYYIIAGPNYGTIVANGLIGPDYNYSLDELQIMEPFGVNCMVYRPGFGTFINSNQTAKQTPVSALSKVNIRELVIYLQDEIEKVLQQYQWEFNTPTTRNAILDKANYICSRVAANGGIEAYINIMDESNNTPEIIENEMAVLSTHIEPGFGCGKMVQELTLYRRGAMASSIKES